MPRKPKITPSEYLALKAKGLNDKEIAELKGITPAAISWMKRAYKTWYTERERVLHENFPFEVPEAMTQTAPYKRLRDHAEWFATGGKGISSGKLKRLRWFHNKLRNENVVVEFDPTIPPNPGVAKAGGWAYRGRLPSDGELMIRVNEYTKLTDDGELIWRLPDEEP